MFNITPKMMSRIFWPVVKDRWNVDIVNHLPEKSEKSVNDITALNLYSLCKMFNIKRVAEVGTWTGRSAIAMAMAAEVHTCDAQYYEDLGKEAIHQYHMRSHEMFAKLEGTFDMVFLDGRLGEKDILHLKRLCTEDTLFCLDDFEGIEKGVYNAMILFNNGIMGDRILIYPQDDTLALLLPPGRMIFTRQ